MTIEVHTDGADILAEKLKGLPQKLQTKISRVILKEALKETGAREELTGYIDTHFKSHTGIYRKSVSGIKTSRVRSDHNRIISYIHFLPVSKVKGGKEQLVITEIPYTMVGAGIGKFLNDVCSLAESKKIVGK